MKHLFFLLLSIFLFASCSNDDEIVGTNDISNPSRNLNQEIKTIEFSYKGKLYSSKYYMEGDSTVILDEEMQEVYNKLQMNHNKLLVVNDNNEITYFDSESEYLGKLKLQLRNTDDGSPYMKVVVRLAHNFNIPFDLGYGAPTTLLIEITLNRRSIGVFSDQDPMLTLNGIPDLKPYNHDDNISHASISLYLGNMSPEFNYRGIAMLSMYEHPNFQGESTGCSAATAWNEPFAMKPGEERGNSEKMPLSGGRYKKSNGQSFNDIISSLKIEIVTHNMNSETGRTSSGGRTDNSSSSNNRGGGETTREERQEILGITLIDGSERPSSGQR